MDLSQQFCPNEKCSDHGRRNQGNLSVRGKYGKDKERDLLYCRTCGKRFAATRSTAFFGMHLPEGVIRSIIQLASEGLGVRATARVLALDKNLVNRVIVRAGEHCAGVLGELLRSLHLTEIQLDELWAFVKKNKAVRAKMTSVKATGEVGYGRQPMRPRDYGPQDKSGRPGDQG